MTEDIKQKSSIKDAMGLMDEVDGMQMAYSRCFDKR
jgi:hypothetical protein